MYPTLGTVETICLNHTISEEWLEAVLRRHYSKREFCTFVAINNFSTSDGCGLRNPVISDIVAVAVDATVNRRRVTHHFIVKLLPLEPLYRFMISSLEFDLREIMFYTEIRHDLEAFQRQQIRDPKHYIRLPIPRCYFAKYAEPGRRSTRASNGTSEESVVVLENLKYMNFLNVDYHKGLTVRQVESAFEALSRVHALTLAMKVKTNVFLNERYTFLRRLDHSSNSYGRMVERNMPKLISFLEGVGGMGGIIRRLMALKPDAEYLIEALMLPDEPISVLVHGDFWVNNLLFRRHECIILDWQMIACSRPTNDLAFLLATSVKTKIRRKYTRRFLKHYWKSLVNNTMKLGVDIEEDLGYSRARLTEDYRRSQLLTLLLSFASMDKMLGRPDTEYRLLDYLFELKNDNLLSRDIIRIHYLNF